MRGGEAAGSQGHPAGRDFAADVQRIPLGITNRRNHGQLLCGWDLENAARMVLKDGIRVDILPRFPLRSLRASAHKSEHSCTYREAGCSRVDVE
jgi:hypothetical protein